MAVDYEWRAFYFPVFLFLGRSKIDFASEGDGFVRANGEKASCGALGFNKKERLFQWPVNSLKTRLFRPAGECKFEYR